MTTSQSPETETEPETETTAKVAAKMQTETTTTTPADHATVATDAALEPQTPQAGGTAAGTATESAAAPARTGVPDADTATATMACPTTQDAAP